MSKFFVCLFLSLSVFANEGGGEGHGGGEAKPEGSANGPATSDQRAVKELMDLEKQVGTTAAKITAKEASVKDLIRQKQTEKDPEKVTEIIKMLQQEHRDLGVLIKEYNSQYGLLQYRYPERGVTLERKYKRFSSQSLEDMEKSIGLEGYLTKSREKVKKVYGVETKRTKTHGKGLNEEAQKDKESILSPSTISK